MKAIYIVIGMIILTLTGVVCWVAWTFAITIPYTGIVISYPFRDLVKYVAIVGFLISIIPFALGIRK